jgi:predicted DCC family thiol-disulfide oxidoreductase YuxK
MDNTPNSTQPKKPLLIYDGDCTFCTYWARYWQRLTGDTVDYQPYQQAAAQFPQIPIDEFKRAVQYVAPDGRISSAAEASFRTLSHARGKAFWLTLYRRLPGFAFLSETAYAFIAAHRTLFYWISLFLWGRDYEPPRYQVIAWLFLRAIGLIYLVAFFSFATQASGLIGAKGIVPINELVEAANTQLGSNRYWLLPMLFWLNTSAPMIQFVCWGGVVFSMLLILNILPRINLLLLYVFYISLITAGQVFMTFQWDYYLIEAGFISIFLIGSTTLAIWLLRFLLFRFIFAGGLVKIFSGDPTWLNFTALQYHFFTQPLPTPLAWYAQQFPSAMLAFGTGATLFIELFLSWLIFFPRHIRFFGTSAILLLQTCILLTGNYNFFNIETIVLCLVCFDDAAIRRLLPAKLFHWLARRGDHQKPHRFMPALAAIFAVITVFTSLVQFQARFTSTMPPASTIWFADSISPLKLVNVYGPFAVMTRTRMEIIIEGSDDELNWKEYAFKYKPGDVYRRPLWNIPFQPRLDWQMWFAALATPEQNPWFLRFEQRLLENSPDVIALLESNPFPNHAPRYIRALFYDYQFTDFEERAKTGAWWKRELVGYYLRDASLSKA